MLTCLVISSSIFILAHLEMRAATHECINEDYTNDLPIFHENRTICNYETVPVLVYSIKYTPETVNETKLCLTGEFAETFSITKKNELKLFGRLEQKETNLTLQIIRTASDIVGTPGERRQAINAIKFELTIKDCTKIVSWQTIFVAILSSVCVVLMSSFAIMLILYQQKGLIRTGKDEERAEEIQHPSEFRSETFINPRRTSSYEFSSLSESTLERQETENL